MRDGYEKLWAWFGGSRASWLTMPRVMMHEMPDEWQHKMADLCEEWDKHWDSSEMPVPFVQARQSNKFTNWPKWLLNYRHPDKAAIQALKTPTGIKAGLDMPCPICEKEECIKDMDWCHFCEEKFYEVSNDG